MSEFEKVRLAAMSHLTGKTVEEYVFNAIGIEYEGDEE